MTKRYYFQSITPWSDSDGREFLYIMWHYYGGKKRGTLSFDFGKTPEELLDKARGWGFIGTPEKYSGDRWGAGAFKFGGGGFPTQAVAAQMI